MIATSANMQFAMQEIVTSFENKFDTSCEIVLSSSGKLTAQIMEGAPYDVFVSANMMYPKELYSKGFSEQPPKVYAYGKLVLCSSKLDQLSIDSLNSDEIRHIAIANPDIAPYGKAAKEVLTKMEIWEALASKFVFGESIAQTNQFIISEAAELGFTAKAVVLSPVLENKITYIDLNSNLYEPIEQGALLIKNRHGKNELSQKFFNFLFSKEAKEILEKYGYFTH